MSNQCLSLGREPDPEYGASSKILPQSPGPWWRQRVGRGRGVPVPLEARNGEGSATDILDRRNQRHRYKEGLYLSGTRPSLFHFIGSNNMKDVPHTPLRAEGERALDREAPVMIAPPIEALSIIPAVPSDPEVRPIRPSTPVTKPLPRWRRWGTVHPISRPEHRPSRSGLSGLP